MKQWHEENKDRPLNIDGADQSEIEEAIKRSMMDMDGQSYEIPQF